MVCRPICPLKLTVKVACKTMTEREKMLAGLPYSNTDPELRQLSSYAKDLVRAYNELPAAEVWAREELLLQLLGYCGEHVRVNQPFFVDYGCHIEINDHSLVNLNCTFLDTNHIIIGKNVLIGPDVKIYTAMHPVYGPDRFCNNKDGSVSIMTLTAPVNIGDYTWIGGGAILLPGVTIGKNVVIGAGSVVTESLPDNAIAWGVPCTIKKWNNNDGPILL